MMGSTEPGRLPGQPGSGDPTVLASSQAPEHVPVGGACSGAEVQRELAQIHEAIYRRYENRAKNPHLDHSDMPREIEALERHKARLEALL